MKINWKYITGYNMSLYWVVIIILVIASISIYWYASKDWETRTGVVEDWNYIQLGFNIFFEEGDTLFLHGGDWKLEEFLESQEYPKTMTFLYHKETTGCDTNCGCTTWNHVTEIYDHMGNKLCERDLWQER